MRVLVTGCQGQVVRALMERGAAAGHEIVTLGRPSLDLADDVSTIANIVAATKPDAIVSAAAYTAVDRAETEAELAHAVNVRGAGAVAAAASALGVPLVHLSTDYVFDGEKDGAYIEDDATGPTGVYGRTKLAGEQTVAAAHDDVAILRTAWVYSAFGANFAKTMLRVAAEREEVGVIADQVGNPTSAFDVADGVLAVVGNLKSSDSPDLRGIFHMTGAGEASWADFAVAIFSASAARGGPSARVRRIATSDFPTLAKRPANSRLNCSKLAAAHGVRVPGWQHSAPIVVDRLLRGGMSGKGILA